MSVLRLHQLQIDSVWSREKKTIQFEGGFAPLEEKKILTKKETDLMAFIYKCKNCFFVQKYTTTASLHLRRGRPKKKKYLGAKKEEKTMCSFRVQKLFNYIQQKRRKKRFSLENMAQEKVALTRNRQFDDVFLILVGYFFQIPFYHTLPPFPI